MTKDIKVEGNFKAGVLEYVTSYNSLFSSLFYIDVKKGLEPFAAKEVIDNTPKDQKKLNEYLDDVLNGNDNELISLSSKKLAERKVKKLLRERKVQMLLEAGAKPNDRYLCHSLYKPRVVELFIKAGIEYPNPPSLNQALIYKAPAETVKLLLLSGHKTKFGGGQIQKFVHDDELFELLFKAGYPPLYEISDVHKSIIPSTLKNLERILKMVGFSDHTSVVLSIMKAPEKFKLILEYYKGEIDDVLFYAAAIETKNMEFATLLFNKKNQDAEKGE